MSYDPLKALQAANILEGSLPPAVEKAISTLSQSEVDLIISQNQDGANCRPGINPWINPTAMPMNGAVTLGCFCGIWSGSGSGPNAQQ